MELSGKKNRGNSGSEDSTVQGTLLRHRKEPLRSTKEGNLNESILNAKLKI